MISCERELDIDNKLNNYLKITGILHNVFRPQKPLKKTRIKLYSTLAFPVLLYGSETWTIKARDARRINPYHTAFPYGNGMVLHFYQQQESSTTKTVHKVINKGLKTYV